MINKIAEMSPAEWANAYKSLDARYRKAELEERWPMADHLGDMLSDMETYQPDWALSVQTLDETPVFLQDQAG